MIEFADLLREKTGEVERIVFEYLPRTEGVQNVVFEAMRYAVEAGGKRLRPLLMHETFRMFGGDGQIVLPFMAAIEFIHTYSLIHDDLPAMDDDDYRRGRLTTHRQFGEAMGILAGDALLNYAFETALRAFSLCGEPCGTAIEEARQSAGMGSLQRYRAVAEAMEVLSKKAGVFGMIGGQVVDVEHEKASRTIDASTLDFIYRLKTGALIEASMMIGAILAGATQEQVSQIEKIAAQIGMAFQIRDDILDVTGTVEELGKPIGSDAKNEKETYVFFYGMEQADAEVKRLSADAIASFRTLAAEVSAADCSFLEELISSLVMRTK